MSDPTPLDVPLPDTGPTQAPSPPPEPPASHAVLRYTALRLAILVAVGAVLYLIGLRDYLLLIFAFLISGLIAMVTLNRTREGAAFGIISAVRGFNARIDAGSRSEDADVAPDIDAADADPDSVVRRPDDVATASPAPPIDEWDDPAAR